MRQKSLSQFQRFAIKTAWTLVIGIPLVSVVWFDYWANSAVDESCLPDVIEWVDRGYISRQTYNEVTKDGVITNEEYSRLENWVETNASAIRLRKRIERSKL